jgi:uncharacterized lipoprotein YddW (UPF0748 family)
MSNTAGQLETNQDEETDDFDDSVDWNALPKWMRDNIDELVYVAAYLKATDPARYVEILETRDATS